MRFHRNNLKRCNLRGISSANYYTICTIVLFIAELVISSHVGPNLAELQFPPWPVSSLAVNAESSSYIYNTGANTYKKKREIEKAGAINLLENFCNQTESQVAIGRDAF